MIAIFADPIYNIFGSNKKGESEMSMIYYIFSKKDLYETICVCEKNDYIDNPIKHTGIYDMGTFLSNAMNFLKSWIEKDFSILQKEDLIMRAINSHRSSTYNLSFSNMAYGDSVAYDILISLLLGNENFSAKREINVYTNLLKCYIQYIKLCTKQKELSTINNLNLLVKANGDTIPIGDIYFNQQSIRPDNWSESLIIDLFSNYSLENKYYKPIQKKRRNRPLFPLKNSLPEIRNNHEKLELPLYVFKIYDVIDLILVSLSCIFENNYKINKCEYCGDLFILGKTRKYCPEPQEKNGMKSCGELAHSKKQSAYEQEEIHRLVKNLRTILNSKYNNYAVGNKRDKWTNFYQEFMHENEIWKTEYKKGKCSETDYIEWLNSRYIHYGIKKRGARKK